MDRRRFITLLGASAVPVASYAQTGKVQRIGALILGNADAASFRKILQKSLADAGYIDGRNVQIDVRSADGKFDRLPGLAAELVSKPVDVLVALYTPCARAVQQATSTIPIVAIAANLVETGLIKDLARPGATTTGVSMMAAEAHGKCVEVLKDLFPTLQRVVALGNASDPFITMFMEKMHISGKAVGIEIVPATVHKSDELPQAFAKIADGGLDALVMQGSLPSKTVAELALKHRVRAVTFTRSFAEVGGLFSYGPDPVDAYQRGISLVIRILQGSNPADIPAEQPTKFELVINLKTANALGIEIPPLFLARADEVIE